MKKWAKIISIPFIAFLLFLCFVAGQVPLIEGYHPLHPLIDTWHRDSFTIEKFDQIKINDTEEKVISLIGKPYYRTPDSFGGVELRFTDDGRLLKYGDNDGYEDFAWYRTTLKLDSNRKVVYIDKGWSFD